MKRPDPMQVTRRPMARASGRVRVSGPAREDTGPTALFLDSALNLDALCRLLEEAEVVSEGRQDESDGAPHFFGSTVLTVELSRYESADQPLDLLVEHLADSIRADRRAQRVINDRVYREIARLLGPETSIDFDSDMRAVSCGSTVRIVADFESVIHSTSGIAR